MRQGKCLCRCGCNRLVSHTTARNHILLHAPLVDQAAAIDLRQRMSQHVPYDPPNRSISPIPRLPKRIKRNQHNDVQTEHLQQEPTDTLHKMQSDVEDLPQRSNQSIPYNSELFNHGATVFIDDRLREFEATIADTTHCAALETFGSRLNTVDSDSDSGNRKNSNSGQSEEDSDASSSAEGYNTDEEALVKRWEYEAPELDETHDLSAYDCLSGLDDVASQAR